MSIIGFVLPKSSWRRKKVLETASKIRKRRRTAWIQGRYNIARQAYYRNLVTKQPPDRGETVSIVVPCFNTPAKYLEPLLASIFSQGYANWELVLVDASDNKAATAYISKRAQADTRIHYTKVSNKGIAANTNVGIDMANGQYIAFLDHDDTLDPNALADSVSALTAANADLVYSDEDKISDDGERYFEPHFKPSFSLDMLRNVNYITHFVVAKKLLVDKVGGIQEGFDGAQDYDFLLRVIDSGAKIVHVPKVLYHWRQAEGSTASNFSNKTNVLQAGCHALDDHYKRNNINNIKNIAIKRRPGFYMPKYQLNDKKKRVIYINANASETEKEFLKSQYETNKSVRKLNIVVTTDKQEAKTASTVLEIKGVYLAINKQVDLSGLFGLAEENGVTAVAPKITRHGRVYDMGYIHVNGREEPLFRGVSVDRNDFFGSLEWVRNVDRVSGRVIAYCNDSPEQGRNIVWSHCEFTALSRQPKNASLDELTAFHNPNVELAAETVFNNDDYVEDLIKADNL